MEGRASIIRGTNDKPVASQSLAEFFTGKDWFNGELLFGYPIIASPEGKHAIDAIWITPDKGVIVFDLIEGNDPGDFCARQDDAANMLEARLKTHRELTSRRDLLVKIHTVSFAPGITDVSKFADPSYYLANLDNLGEIVAELDWPGADERVFRSTLSAIQSISTIRSARTKRVVTNADSRGAKLKRLEDAIATLDSLQEKAVLETANGVQRIRGLAGSGKTIVLALKAAYLHTQHPDWRIAVTFNTRALKGQFKRLINNFVLEQANEEPNFENLRIISAWGAPGGTDRDGIYYEFCRAHNITYLDFGSAKGRFGEDNEFSGACEYALSQMQERKKLYDAILVDEAQDFPPSFLRLCYELLDDSKRLVYAYDELQNLSGRSLPPPEEIFGTKADGSPVVSFADVDPGEPRRDIMLQKCYRNSRPVLVTAHALGFGIYREPPSPGATGLVQMFDYPQLWEEIGYREKEGELREGAHVTLYRTEASSPKFLEEHSDLNDLIQFIQFKTEAEQTEWLVNAIQTNIERDELRHDDIVVINPNPLTTRTRVGPVRSRLLAIGINSHLAGVDTNPDVFFQSETPSVTFSGIHRAKGNEAGMVYIMNAQDCHSEVRNLATLRNRLFTAITRSKAWVRVVGVGERMAQLVQEYERLKDHNYELSFTYPTEAERKQLQIIHRDVTPEQQKLKKSREQGLAELIRDLESGNLIPEELDPKLWEKLHKIMSKKQRG